MDPTAPSADSSDSLYFKSVNPSAPVTILFLHGLGASHHELDGVTRHIQTLTLSTHITSTTASTTASTTKTAIDKDESDPAGNPTPNGAAPAYHLLLPDLPGHSRSAHIPPSSIPAQSALIASLIKTHAHSSRAHVVGISAGGFVAQHLASTQPHLVTSLFVTGCAPLNPLRRWIALHPEPLLACQAVYDSRYVPLWLKRKVNPLHDAPSEELERDLADNGKNWRLFKVVAASLADFGGDDLVRAVGKSGVRTCAVAAAKDDDVDATGRQGCLLRGDGEAGDEVAVESRDPLRMRNKAVVLRNGHHAWSLQYPDLFARAVIAWANGDELPVEFEDL